MDWDGKTGDKVLLCKEDNLNKLENEDHHYPCTVFTVHMNDLIIVQHGTKSE